MKPLVKMKKDRQSKFLGGQIAFAEIFSRPGVLHLAAVCLFLLGGYGSLKVAFHLLEVDGDSVHSLVLWQGVQEYGLSFLGNFKYTQDSWLFSLVPFQFLLFWLAGPNVALLPFSGWLIFLASALMGGVISWQMGARKAAIIVPLLLIFLGEYAHKHGFATYPTSHNITNLFGLFSLSLFLNYIHNRKKWALVGLSGLLIAAGLSDLWLAPSYLLPILLATVVLIFVFQNQQDKKDLVILVGFLLAVQIIKQVAFFGPLDNIPKSTFYIGSFEQILYNIEYYLRNTGALLNVIPGNASNSLLASLVSLFAVSLLSISVLYHIKIFKIRDVPVNHLALLLFVIFSVGGISLSYLLYKNNLLFALDNPATDGLNAFADSKIGRAMDHSGRFLLNIVYVVIIGLGVFINLYWHRYTFGYKIAVIFLAFLFMTSGVASHFHFLHKSGFQPRIEGTTSRLNFLKSHDLSYGYGTYFSSRANVLTMAAKGEVVMRPIEFDAKTGQVIFGERYESSKFWYTQSDIPDDQKDFYIFLESTDDACPDMDLCQSALVRQFGAPVKIIENPQKKWVAMVWEHSLLDDLE